MHMSFKVNYSLPYMRKPKVWLKGKRIRLPLCWSFRLRGQLRMHVYMRDSNLSRYSGNWDSLIREVFVCEIQNLGLWNHGIWNTAKKKSGIRYPIFVDRESGIHSMESRIQDCFGLLQKGERHLGKGTEVVIIQTRGPSFNGDECKYSLPHLTPWQHGQEGTRSLRS